jgi:acyl-homoserine-lactone acylase
VASDDVLAHGYQLLIAFLMYEYDYWAIQSYAEAGKKHDDVPGGSNGIAIAPARSASGTAMLVINPHLPWQGELMFFESHLVAGEVDAYGASLLGQPFLALGFTRHLGWTHTVNPADAFDTYELELEDDGYRFDGEVKAFQREDPQELAVRKEDGTTEKVLVERLRSVHGPVVYLDDRRKRALAVRIAAATDFRPERFWKIVEATNLEEFENVTDEHPLPFFNTIFADSDGNILFQYNATLPDRGRGDFESWLGILPGDDPDYLWEDMLPVSAMPKIVNPDTGFVQNANDPPWSATYPFALDTGDFPAWLPPPAMDFRAQSLTRMLHDDREISFDELVRIKQSNRVEMAGRVLPDLLAVCDEADAELLDKACRTLAGWDRTVDPDSRGAVLFLAWVDAMGGVDGDWYAEPWSVTRPLSTPNGLAAPEDALETLAAVAAEIDESFGAVDAAYGQVYRMRLGGRDVPARTGDASAGMPAVGGFDRAGDGHYEITDGDTFFAVVQFSKPLRAEGLLPYGNSSQPDSPHVGDQLELFSKGELRRLWLDRDDVLENLELRETFD